MKTKSVPSGWLGRDGRRLDCGPYMSGALEARVRLEHLKARKDTLREVTLGGMAGIFNGPRFARSYVDDARFGVPFLGSTDILNADLTGLPLLSRRQVEANPRLVVREGWTLITCSGTIGRMAFARSDMDGMAGSQHFMRVVPDPERIPPGYLYAYLSSKFGVPLIVGGTYGAIIQHIEPEHIAGLLVPRLSTKLEREVHERIESSSSLRVRASASLRAVAARFDSLVAGVEPTRKAATPRITLVPASSVQRRLDAQFHDPLVQRVRERLQAGAHKTIGEFCDRVVLPGIFKRIHIDDVAYGAPYYTGAALFWLEPVPKGILARRTSLFDEVSLEKGTVLVQAFGQEGGITGRSVWVGRHLDGATTTHMLVRLRASTEAATAYLFGFLQSGAAYRQIASLPYGGSIPHLDEAGIATVVIPVLANDDQRTISQQVLSAVTDRDDALALERSARAIVESAIEKAAH